MVLFAAYNVANDVFVNGTFQSIPSLSLHSANQIHLEFFKTTENDTVINFTELEDSNPRQLYPNLFLVTETDPHNELTKKVGCCDANFNYIQVPQNIRVYNSQSHLLIPYINSDKLLLHGNFMCIVVLDGNEIDVER